MVHYDDDDPHKWGKYPKFDKDKVKPKVEIQETQEQAWACWQKHVDEKKAILKAHRTKEIQKLIDSQGIAATIADMIDDPFGFRLSLGDPNT